jgi:PAS domain S-box-containing protein
MRLWNWRKNAGPRQPSWKPDVISEADIIDGNILIVDDQEANVALLEQILRGAGYRLITATRDPRAVCQLHRKNRYDLILLDLQMPGLDGFQVMEELKAIEVGSYLPVLVITAQPGHKVRALHSGAKDFISKPFELAEVLIRVHNMIEVRLLLKQGTVVNVARLENAQRIAGVGDWEYDFSTKHRLRWSEEIYNILGITRKEYPPSAETFYSLVHPEDLDFVHQEKKAVAKGLRRVEFMHRIIRPSGEIRHVRQIAEMTFDDMGEPSRESGTIQDLTEQKAAELARHETQERYRRMLTLSPDALFVNVDGIITFVNRAFCEMMGATDPAQLIGRSALEISHASYLETVVERRRKLADGHSMPPIEIKYRRLDGTTVDVEVTSVAFDFQGHKEVQVIARDISIRLRAATVLRESEERFRLVARAVSDVVWDWNIAANSLWWNDGFLSTFGYSATDIKPSVENWTDRIHPDDRARVAESIERAIGSSADSWTSEYRFRRKDGSFATVHDQAFILRDEATNAVRVVGGMRDMTEQMKMEAQFLRAQRMESIGTLAGGIAHDLNNVLAPILMGIELLKQDTREDPRRSRILETIHVSCRRGADLVRQVLSFARGDQQQRVAIRLEGLIGDVKAVITQTFPRNIRISTNISEGLWPITGDPSQLHQVLLNLVVNARDSMPHGGTLAISASNFNVDAQFAATSQDAKTGAFVLLEVADGGSGIPPEVRDRMFEPFFTTKEVGKGTGLGLATVHTVVKSHGGFLAVDSEMDRGSTFKVYLPADAAIRKTEIQSPHTAEIPRGNNELVMVVDDEHSVRDITQQTLEAFGYRVVTAADGASAVAVYAKLVQEVAVVITDMMMPVMDGAATIHVLKCINPSVRIIAASGLELAENMAKATSAGVFVFLQKPFTAQDLLQKVHEVINEPDLRSVLISSIHPDGRFRNGSASSFNGNEKR